MFWGYVPASQLLQEKPFRRYICQLIGAYKSPWTIFQAMALTWAEVLSKALLSITILAPHSF